ncbi:MAG: hypothetical protein K5772_04570 [Clostridia bacterium]|nr:hypothetical protein [Clostridia bacterium]
MPEVKDRILSAYDSLSKAQKKAADFIISNFDASAMCISFDFDLLNKDQFYHTTCLSNKRPTNDGY